MARCKYGKLKHPTAGRRCKRRRAHARKAKRSSRRRMKRGTKVGIGLGTLALLGAGAYFVVPQISNAAMNGFGKGKAKPARNPYATTMPVQAAPYQDPSNLWSDQRALRDAAIVRGLYVLGYIASTKYRSTSPQVQDAFLRYAADRRRETNQLQTEAQLINELVEVGSI